MIKYSGQTGGFYVSAIHGDKIPSDAVEITEEVHDALLAGLSSGQSIVLDANGTPTLQRAIDPRSEAQILADAKALSGAAMLRWIEAFTAPLTAKYPSAERAMWPMKLPAAQSILADTATEFDLAIFATEAAAAQITVKECAAAAVAKGTVFAQVAASISGLRQATETAIAAATTPAAVTDALTHAKATAEQLAPALGLSVPQSTGV